MSEWPKVAFSGGKLFLRLVLMAGGVGMDQRPAAVDDALQSGRGGRLFFGANRRQAAGFRQCWMALEMLGLPLVF